MEHFVLDSYGSYGLYLHWLIFEITNFFLRWRELAGTIFTEDMRELESVYEYVIREVHNKATDGRFRVNTTASTLLTDDPFNLTRERESPSWDVYKN